MAQGSAGKPPNLFQGTTGDWQNIAMLVGTTTASVSYAACFKEAGDALVDRGVATHTKDLAFFPALYCYRHAVETVMKEIAYLWDRAQGKPLEMIRTHKLTVIWPRTRAALEGAWPTGDATELDAMESVIGDLAAVDPDGDQFRYDRDTAGYARELPAELARVDLRHVANVMDELVGTLMGAVDGIDAMLSAGP